MKDGFKKCPFEYTLYIKKGDQGKFLMVFLYVDDLIFTGNSTSMCDEFKRNLICEFEMIDMGLLHFFLGIEVKQQDGIFISQKKYANNILKRLKMKSATPLYTLMEVGLKLSKSENEESVDRIIYRSLVSSLMYLTATRSNLMFAVSMLSRFMESPKKSHWEAGKSVLRYLCGNINKGIHYKSVKDSTLISYCDSDWGRKC